MELERPDREQIKGVVDREIVREWRRTCTDNAVSQNEALERILRWYVAQDRTTQQYVLAVIPPELRAAAANHVIRSIVDWAGTSSDVEIPPPELPASAELDRLREAARLYHVTMPPTRRPDGSVEQVTRSYERTDPGTDPHDDQDDDQDDLPGPASRTPPRRNGNGAGKQGVA